MSRYYVARRPKAKATGLLLVISALVGPLALTAWAEQNPTDIQRAFRRVFVPADAPEDWPVEADRYLPVPRDQFSRLVQQSQHSDATARPRDVFIRSAIYRAEFIPTGTLRGSTELEVSLAGDQPRILPLSPLGFSVTSARLRGTPPQQAALGLWQREGNDATLGVIVEKSGILELQWEQPGRGSDEGSTTFVLQKPVAVPQTLELALPPNHLASVSGAELLSREVGSLGEVSLKFQLASVGEHRLRIERPTRGKSVAVRPLASQSTSYELRPEGLNAVTQFRIDARDQAAAELRALLPTDVQVVDVTIDQQSIPWQVVNGEGSKSLVFTRPESIQPQAVAVTYLAKLRSETPWSLPRVQFDAVAWTEGTTSLLISPELSLRSITPRRAALQHIVGVEDATRSGEVFRFQEWASGAELIVEVGRKPSRLVANAITRVELRKQGAQATVVAALSSVGSQNFQVRALVAPGWSIDSVSTTPKLALKEWHVDPYRDGSRIFFQLRRPITAENPLRIEVEAHESRVRPQQPVRLGELKLLKFQDATIDHEFLEVGTGGSTQLELSDDLSEATVAWEEAENEDSIGLFDGLKPLVDAALIDLERGHDEEKIQVMQQPVQYRADLQINVDAFAEVFVQQYELDITPVAGAVREIAVEFDTPPSDPLRWTIVNDATEVIMQQVPGDESSGGATSPAKYVLRLSKPKTGPFRLIATDTRGAQKLETCNLLQLSSSLDWQGQVRLSGALEGIHIDDQGWTPTVAVNKNANASKLPVLGVYRLGLDEQRRASRMALQMKRLPGVSTASQLTAWLAEYHTLQAANGRSLHVASYCLENSGASEATIAMPARTELQEIWINDRQLEAQELIAEKPASRIRLEVEDRWPRLTLKYSSHERPLEGSATIDALVPGCSFPIQRGRWTLWAPEQYEITNAQQSFSVQRDHWWSRLFGPLARARGATVFNPLRRGSWTQVWSTPIESRQNKKIAEKCAESLAVQLGSSSRQPLSTFLSSVQSELGEDNTLYVDRTALLTARIHSDPTSRELLSAAGVTNALASIEPPLPSYRLALLVSPAEVVVTTTERVAHWRDQLRPTEIAGVFVVAADELSDHISEACKPTSSEFVTAAQWLSMPVARSSVWVASELLTFADVGRRASTVEFVGEPPTQRLRRLYVSRALWYAIVLLTVVLGVWKLAHYPNATILTTAVAAATCLVASPGWLPMPQAIFLGLIGSAIVRVVIRSTKLAGQSTSVQVSGARITATGCVALLLLLGGTAVHADESAAASKVAAATDGQMTRVLVPVDPQGNVVGEDVYVPEQFLQRLTKETKEASRNGAAAVILSATYSGQLPRKVTTANSIEAGSAAKPWTLAWEIESFEPGCTVIIPLRREQARWLDQAHRLDGIPVQLLWSTSGDYCSVVLPQVGKHSLQVVGVPRVAIGEKKASIQLQLPPLASAKLELAHQTELPAVRLNGFRRRAREERGVSSFWLGATGILDLSWELKSSKSKKVAWERLEQSAWLHIGAAETHLDVQIAMNGYKKTALPLGLEVSGQLALEPVGADSPIAEVSVASATQATRLRLKLRDDLPPDFVIPLRFRLQRASSTGRVYFPWVRVLGGEAAQSTFAVSVASGLSFEEQGASNLQRIAPTEFTVGWDAALAEPLFAYVLDEDVPQWSIRVRPDPKSLAARQSMLVRCLTKQVQVDYEAAVSNLSGSWLIHRLEVPGAMQVESISVIDQADSSSVPLRWSRAHPTEVVVFLGRPIREDYLLRCSGFVEVRAQDKIAVPQISLLDARQGQLTMDLHRSEDVQISWASPELAPAETESPNLARADDEVNVGQFRWRPSQRDQLSQLQLAKNEQLFEVSSVTTFQRAAAGWRAWLNGRFIIRQGVVHQLTVEVPSTMQRPFLLQPENAGEISEIEETGSGKRITVELAQSIGARDLLELRVSGAIKPPADQRLAAPAMRWRDAIQREQYVILPTASEGRPIQWRIDGLKRQELPQYLEEFIPAGQSGLPCLVMQQSFAAKEWAYRGDIHSAQIRHAAVRGILDANYHLIATAEFILQPGRASSCAIQLPTGAHLSQLVVGGMPVRRERQQDGSWRIPIGPPLMPQRILVSYRNTAQLDGRRLQLTAPKVLLAGNALPDPRTWWHLTTIEGLRLGTPEFGQLITHPQFVRDNYRIPLEVIEDALSESLELPMAEGDAWAAGWKPVFRQAEINWRTHDLSEADTSLLALAEVQKTLSDAFDSNARPADELSAASFPPQLPAHLGDPARRQDLFVISDDRAQLVIGIASDAQHNLWRWFAATALVCGALALVLHLRSRLNWHYDLCLWPHTLAFVGGFAWWVLLEPGVLGLLVMLLALASSILRKLQSAHQRRKKIRSAQLALPTTPTS